MKMCKKCGECKPLDQFYRHESGRDGYRNHCKTCVCSRVSLYAKGNPRVLEAKRAYRTSKPEQIKALMRAAYLRRKQDYKDASRKWQAKNRAALGDAYLRAILAATTGVSRLSVSHELVELKREQLTLHRLAKELEGAAKKAKDET
jgi:hypothetical protein